MGSYFASQIGKLVPAHEHEYQDRDRHTRVILKGRNARRSSWDWRVCIHCGQVEPKRS